MAASLRADDVSALTRERSGAPRSLGRSTITECAHAPPKIAISALLDDAWVSSDLN